MMWPFQPVGATYLCSIIERIRSSLKGGLLNRKWWSMLKYLSLNSFKLYLLDCSQHIEASRYIFVEWIDGWTNRWITWLLFLELKQGGEIKNSQYGILVLL